MNVRKLTKEISSTLQICHDTHKKEIVRKLRAYKKEKIDSYEFLELISDLSDYDICTVDIDHKQGTISYINNGETYRTTLCLLKLEFKPEKLLISTYGGLLDHYSHEYKKENFTSDQFVDCPECGTGNYPVDFWNEDQYNCSNCEHYYEVCLSCHGAILPCKCGDDSNSCRCDDYKCDWCI